MRKKYIFYKNFRPESIGDEEDDSTLAAGGTVTMGVGEGSLRFGTGAGGGAGSGIAAVGAGESKSRDFNEIIFESVSKRAWTDVLLQIYKVFRV